MDIAVTVNVATELAAVGALALMAVLLVALGVSIFFADTCQQ